MPAEKLSGFLDDRLARLLNQACNSLYERGVLEALRVKYDNIFCCLGHTYFIFFDPQALAYNRDQAKLVKATADKLKTCAVKLLASSKSNSSRDGNYFPIVTSTFINTYFWGEKKIQWS